MAHLYRPLPDGKKPPAWRNSPAKAVLRDGIIDKVYLPEMGPEVVYASNEIFWQYKFANFKTNLTNLRLALARDIGRANSDAEYLAADLLNHPPIAVAAQVLAGQGYPIWAGSEAEHCLKEDVDQGRHLMAAPKELYESRDEYQEWPLDVFRDHIYQELRRRKTQSYWLHRDKKQSANEAWPKIDSL